MFIQTENSHLQAGRFLQYGAMSQIVGSPGVDIHHAPSFNGVDDRTAEFLRDSRTAETPSQTSSPACHRRIGIGSSVHHNGALTARSLIPFSNPFRIREYPFLPDRSSPSGRSPRNFCKNRIRWRMRWHTCHRCFCHAQRPRKKAASAAPYRIQTDVAR